VTFNEFIRYVLWDHEENNHADIHWRPQYEVCRPCYVKYDYLGYYETIHDDAKNFLRNIDAGPDVQFPSHDHDSRQRSSKVYLNMYENITASDIRRLLDFYKNDYHVYGIEVPDTIRRRLDKAVSRR